jgi:hypothetical protein
MHKTEINQSLVIWLPHQLFWGRSLWIAVIEIEIFCDFRKLPISLAEINVTDFVRQIFNKSDQKIHIAHFKP